MNDSELFKQGDVTGPAAATNNAVALWSGVTGKLLKNSTATLPASGVLGDVTGPASSTNNVIALWDGVTGRLLKNSTATLPASTIVGTTDTQSITNKYITTQANTAAWSAAAPFQVLSNAVSDAGSGAFMTFIRNGAFGVNFGLDTDNTLKVAGYSLGAVIPWSVTSTGVMGVNRAVFFRAPYSLTASSAATEVNFALGQKVHLTLSASTTVTCAFPGVGNYQILLIQDGTGNRTVTWSASNNVQYVGSATAPAINLPANTMTMVSIYWSGSGTFIQALKVNAA